MKTKRVLAGFLWFWAVSCAWAMLATFVGLPGTAGPILGLAAAVLVAGDPFNRIWPAKQPEAARESVPNAMPDFV